MPKSTGLVRDFHKSLVQGGGRKGAGATVLAQNNPGKAAPGGRCRGRLLTCGALPASGAFTPAPPPPLALQGSSRDGERRSQNSGGRRDLGELLIQSSPATCCWTDGEETEVWRGQSSWSMLYFSSPLMDTTHPSGAVQCSRAMTFYYRLPYSVLILRSHSGSEDFAQFTHALTRSEHTGHLRAWRCPQLWTMQLQITLRFPSEDCRVQGKLISNDSQAFFKLLLFNESLLNNEEVS